MRLKRYIALTLCLFVGMLAFAQGVKKTPLSIVDNGNGELCVHFRHPGVGLMVVGWGYHRLINDGLYLGNGPVGHPNLPTLSTLLRLPEGSTLTVNNIEVSEVVTEGFFIFGKNCLVEPITEGWFKERGWPGYQPDSTIYATNGWYCGGKPLEVEHLGRMGHEEVYRLTVRPVAYNPVRGDLKEWTTIDATIKVKNGEPSAESGREVFLIVSRPQFREGLQPFVQWKRQEGYAVEELYADTNSRTLVKALMRPFFDNANALHPMPRYTLLVGDHEQLEAFHGTLAFNGESHFTDLYYADFTGDYLPETQLGRWPVNDTAELRAVVEKTLRYEQMRDMDTLQLKRMLLVAGEEYGSPAPTTTNGQVNYLKREVMLAHPEMDTLCWYNPTSGRQGATIASAIGEGASLLNYTAHCTYSGWSNPTMTADTIEAAGTTQPTVYVNNCCQSNAFTGTGFGERLLRMPVGGAAGVIGATNSTLWQEDYFWAVGPKYPLSLEPAYDSTMPGAFDGLIGQRRTTATLGELLQNGNLAVTAFGTTYDKYYWEIYCLLGDPSLKPWIGVPQPISLQVTDGLSNGETLLQVSGTPGAHVTSMQDSVLLGVADIDATGLAVIELCQPLDTLPLVVTSTGVNLWPRVDTFSVAAVESGVTLRNVAVSDSAVHCTVENIGNTRYDSLRVELSQVRTQTRDGAVIEFQIVIVDSLLPHGQTEVTIPVNVVALGQEPLWDALLSLWDFDHGIMCWLPVSHDLPVTYPTLTTRLLDNDGNEAPWLLAGEDYLLEVSTEGPLDSIQLTITSHPDAGTLVHQTTPSPTFSSSFTTPDLLCSLHIEGTLCYRGWSQRQDYWLEAGSRNEGFEHGFGDRPWDNSGRVPWTLDSTVSHGGRFSVRSGAVDHGQITELCLDATLPHRDSIGFWLRTSTETQRDRLTFLVDGVAMSPTWSGESDWQHAAFALTAGEHRLCWRYSKNASNSRGDDCVWIDDIRMPMARWQEAGDWECTTAPVDIQEIENPELEMEIFPNPASGKTHLLSNETMKVYITDALGRTVDAFVLQGGETTAWNAPKGIYFATGINSKGTVSRIIIIR